jgi:hypothetical protein
MFLAIMKSYTFQESDIDTCSITVTDLQSHAKDDIISLCDITTNEKLPWWGVPHLLRALLRYPALEMEIQQNSPPPPDLNSNSRSLSIFL